MVLKSEVESFLRTMHEVCLIPYGNATGRGSVVTDPPSVKDFSARADLFDLDRIGSAVIQIPSVFQRTETYGRASSYGLKHVLERATGQYISNGDMIVAFKLSGFKVKFPRDGKQYAVNAVVACSRID